ncbi:MAG: tetratricopeptide repeat protein [Verrucomicrobiota bacterium]
MRGLAYGPLFAEDIGMRSVRLPGLMAGLGYTLGFFAMSCVVQAKERAGELESACRAMSNGAGALAVSRLEAFLSGATGDVAERRAASLLLAQGYLRVGKPERVGGLLKEWEADPEALRWMAQAHFELGFWGEAALEFSKAIIGGVDVLACTLARAEALSWEGFKEDALAALLPVLQQNPEVNALRFAVVGLRLDLGKYEDARHEWREIRPRTPVEEATARYLEGRLWLVEGKVSEASERFLWMLAPEHEVPASVYVGSVLGQAEVLVSRGKPEEAIRFLAGILRSEREVPGEEVLFQRLATLVGESPEAQEDEFLRWARLPDGNRRAYARFYLAQIFFSTGKPQRAHGELTQFLKDFPNHPLRPQALLQCAELQMEGGQWDSAASLLKEGLGYRRELPLSQQFRIRYGLVLLRQGRFQEALDEFDSMANRDAQFGVVIGYNAAVAALRLGDMPRVNQELRALRENKGTETLVADLELEMALQLARDGKGNAEEVLRTFLTTHPGHSRQGDARVALAELAYKAARNKGGNARAGHLMSQASAYLQAVAGDPQSPRAAAQAEYLAIFLADEAPTRDDAMVIDLGEAFLRNHPESELVAEIRMKLGEVYLRRKDYANAETQFASVAKGQADGELLWNALYLAGQCASGLLNPGSVERALGYWDRVVQGGGPLHWEARYQQAAVKSRIGEEADGVVLFDLILAPQSDALQELKLSARCGKADALLALARRSGGSLEDALVEYKRLFEDSGVTAYWRNQALYKTGKAKEGRQDLDGALEAFYRVLELPGSVEAGEFFWLFKSGFDATRILEGRRLWKDAIGLYERLGRIGGPRSEEAKARARQLRLEHFLWE